ncbi:hypothetical protein [Muricomes intestini]|uniref:hypothetical protein n=1 Tax=Muricomes intestini TaxID=1796634 RepID=UPI002FDE4CDB
MMAAKAKTVASNKRHKAVIVRLSLCPDFKYLKETTKKITADRRNRRETGITDQFLKISKMAVQKKTSDTEKIKLVNFKSSRFFCAM